LSALKRIILPVAILAAAVVFFIFLVRTPATLEAIAPEQAVATVRVAAVQPQSVVLEVRSQGRVQASRRVSLSAAAAGPVSWISPSLVAGGYFNADDVILRIDSRDYETALERSRSSLAQAQSEAAFAADELARNADLAERRLISESQLRELQRQVDLNNSRVRDARAAVAQAELDLRRSEVRAPFATIVESTSIELGQTVSRGQALASLLSADEAEVRLPLSLSQLAYLDIPLGSRGELPAELAPDVRVSGMFAGEMQHWQGQLVRMEASIDLASNAMQAIVRVTHEQDSLPLPVGLYVEASVTGKRVEDIFVLPREVIRGNNRVLVVDNENRMWFREVDILRLENERVLIQGGLAAGERICLSPIQAVIDGMLVQVVDSTQTASPINALVRAI